MPLSSQHINDICSTLFVLESRQRATVKKSVVGGTSFAPTAEERDEILRSIATWAHMDDVAFEAVFFYHPMLPKVLRWLVLDIGSGPGLLAASIWLAYSSSVTPEWLVNEHRALDGAVAEAYGWGDDFRAGALTDDEILARLFRLNQQRAYGGARPDSP